MTDSQIDALVRKFDQEDYRAARRAATAKLSRQIRRALRQRVGRER